MESSEEKWVDMTNEQIRKEIASCSKIVEGSSLSVHPPQEPIPDDDWEGGTWGLFWPDLEEFDELKEDPEKYVKKHYEDKSKTPKYPPANLKADISAVETITAPAEEKPVIVAAPPPPVAAPPPVPPPATPSPAPTVVLRPKKVVLPPQEPVIPIIKPEIEIPCENFDPVNIDNDNSKWSWMRSSDQSAGRARFSLSIYW
eukprot:GFUD01007758.1.p1 GENE.GFUD01007758.1~~GFUD01007758.1.p1  ORF type:complete len:200 (-),score=69.69 GFUD01007758.1:90-689(-)